MKGNSTSAEDLKPKKSRGFFSKFWKSKDDKKQLTRSLDTLPSYRDHSIELDTKFLNENTNNSKKSRSLDILNGPPVKDELNSIKKVSSPLSLESHTISYEKLKGSDDDLSISRQNRSSIDNSDVYIEKSETISNNYLQNSSEADNLKNNEDEKNKDTSDLELNFDKNSKKDSVGKKSKLTLQINNKETYSEHKGLSPKALADKLYNLEESEYQGKPILLILTETDPYHVEALEHFMNNFNFSYVEIDEALRILCKKVVITGETQQIDRLLAQFSKHFFESNPHRQDLFVNEDVTHTIVYSLVLLNTDLHIVYNDTPNKKMTKKEFLKNTMTLLESMVETENSSKSKSANIPSNYRKSCLYSPSSSTLSTPSTFTSATLPRNFTETIESKQKKWKKNMEQLLGELYNSIKSKKILQRVAPTLPENENTVKSLDALNSTNSIQSDSASYQPGKIQSLFGNESKGSNSSSAFSSMKNLINKTSGRKTKDKNVYLSMPILNPSDSASYSSEYSYTNKSYDKLSSMNKSFNLINSTKGNTTSRIAYKGALKRKHHLDQNKQRAKDRRWAKCHCALFVDQTGSANGVCELRIWLESSSSSSKKKNMYNRDMDEIFDIAANEPEMETQNIPYLNLNYNEALPITHSVANIIKNYTAINAPRSNIFSLKLSSGNTYLFEAEDEVILKEWVNTINFWAARRSKEPLRGAVGNMEYGWNLVEKIEIPKDITDEEIQEPIPFYDIYDSSFDSESVKSAASASSRTNSLRITSRSPIIPKSDTHSIKDINPTNGVADSSSSTTSSYHTNSIFNSNISNIIKDERMPRSFTLGRFRSPRRSSSHNDSLEVRPSARSLSLNREEGENGHSDNRGSTIRSYSCTRQDYGGNDSLTINTNVDVNININITTPSNHSGSPTPSRNSLDEAFTNEKPPVLFSTLFSYEDRQKKSEMVKDDIDYKSLQEMHQQLEKRNIIEDHGLGYRRNLSEPQLKTRREMDKNSSKRRSQSLNNEISSIHSDIHDNLDNSITSTNTSNINNNNNSNNNSNSNGNNVTTISPIGMILPEPNKTKLESDIIKDDLPSTQFMTLPYRSSKKSNRNASKHQSLIPDKLFSSNRFSIQSVPISNASTSGNTTTTAAKKKIKKLRICDWIQPGVGFLLSTLTLEKQYESMKRQYLIKEKELEEHREIKQPMEDLYVFQSTPYQKACHNWKKKYMYLLDERNKYGLYTTILEAHMKEDPREEHLFPEDKKVSNDSMYHSTNNSLDPLVSPKKSSNIINSELFPLPENKETLSNTPTTPLTPGTPGTPGTLSTPGTPLTPLTPNVPPTTPICQSASTLPTVPADEIRTILAKKRQQQLDMLKKTADDLAIDSNNIDKSLIIPDINITDDNSTDDEYEKEMEELALEQERILNFNKD